MKVSALDPSLKLRIARISATTFRATIRPVVDGKPVEVRPTGSLVPNLHETVLLDERWPAESHDIRSGNWTAAVMGRSIRVVDSKGIEFSLGVDPSTMKVTVDVQGSLFGLGEGGRQFDRRGGEDVLVSGQSGYRLATHGSRVPIPWLVCSGGWAIFFHHADGVFDLKEFEASFRPEGNHGVLDLFVVVSKVPTVLMAEYARLTGFPELPPLWSLGYLQSHRTLGDPSSILAEAKTFREKRLPCEAMIYLGTGFCPNGWNVRNGSFEWNAKAFPDPKAMIAQLHADHFKVIPHVVIEARTLHGAAGDKVDMALPDISEASVNWNLHRPVLHAGVDGWWPDEGDWFDMPARLTRNRMYWEGPQIDRPRERPFSLHRNGAPGMQRYGSFLWSGDVESRWETLATHIQVGLNTGLSGIPLWGTDIGGFIPTSEFTAELFIRWFQFGAFCPLFRCHGRNWTLRLPWGWNTGNSGPLEIRDAKVLPDASQLHNAAVEPICRKYLELRSRLMPYLYSVVRESTLSGLPVMRALWLHYPDEDFAVARSDQYLWGRDIFVAPVVRMGATSRRLYLPRGTWYDFWTRESVEGGRFVERPVDLETMPLFVRAGAILPMGPVRQYVGEPVEGPLELHIFPGVDGRFEVYEDDGESFDYRRGEWTGIEASWHDASKTISLRLARGPKKRRPIALHLGDAVQTIMFEGHPVSHSFAS